MSTRLARSSNNEASATGTRRPLVSFYKMERSKEDIMKNLMSLLILAALVVVSSTVFAGDVSSKMTKAECDEAGGVWHADTKKCSNKM